MDFRLSVCPTGECELARACIGTNGDVCEVPTSLIDGVIGSFLSFFGALLVIASVVPMT